jgi:hypothetical protein
VGSGPFKSIGDVQGGNGIECACVSIGEKWGTVGERDVERKKRRMGEGGRERGDMRA